MEEQAVGEPAPIIDTSSSHARHGAPEAVTAGVTGLPAPAPAAPAEVAGAILCTAEPAFVPCRHATSTTLPCPTNPALSFCP
jgi:hypothetical protein